MYLKLKLLLGGLLLFPLWFLIKSNRNVHIIYGDISEWLRRYHKSQIVSYKNFVWLMVVHKPFRNVLYYRIKGLSLMFSWLYKKQDTTFISGNSIGKGLFLCHGFATTIGAKSIGENCWINQQVTIGHANGGDPVIGNNVYIFAGAIVLGNIKIGDNAVIAAGAVVLKNVPNDCIAIGNPAQILRKDDI